MASSSHDTVSFGTKRGPHARSMYRGTSLLTLISAAVQTVHHSILVDAAWVKPFHVSAVSPLTFDKNVRE